MCTGPGRAPLNTAKAWASTSGSVLASNSVWLNRATPLIICCWLGSSCNRPWPMPSVSRRLTLEITSMGIESARAWPMAVAILVIPGPVIIRHTPG